MTKQSFFRVGVLAVLLVFVYVAQLFPRQPLSSSKDTIIIEFQKGASVKTMVHQMQRAGLVSHLQGLLLDRWIRWKGLERQLRAGEYALSRHLTPRELVQKLKKGDVIQYSITFSEGITFEEALRLLQKHPAIRVIPDWETQDWMLALGEPTRPPEGLFFPSTYTFPRGTHPLVVLKKARQLMEQQLKQIFDGRSPQCILQTPYEALILASIIEKESALPSERPVISGVFQRRLKNNMLLQADPTLIYGLRKEFNGRLTYAQLKQDFPYNTYVRKGLPPTPIALPSINALIAACHPDLGESLYFVAKGDGTHYFSKTLTEHQAAVNQYQKGQAK